MGYPERLTKDNRAQVFETAVEIVSRFTLNDEGVRWYLDAHNWCRRIGREYGHTVHQVAWAVAALSPMSRWERNQDDVIRLLEGEDTWTFKYAQERAERALAGECSAAVIGQKVRSFGHNLSQPYTSFMVTLDRHMATALELPERYIERTGVYGILAEAVRAQARQLQCMPHQLQASIWVETRGSAE